MFAKGGEGNVQVKREIISTYSEAESKIPAFSPIFLMRNSFLGEKTLTYMSLGFAAQLTERGELCLGTEPELRRSPAAQYSFPKFGDEIL